VLVLEKGKLGFDGDVDEGIKYLHYDEGDDADDDEGFGPDN
jgi:ABC-2 type transport system ATP-binding protein